MVICVTIDDENVSEQSSYVGDREGEIKRYEER